MISEKEFFKKGEEEIIQSSAENKDRKKQMDELMKTNFFQSAEDAEKFLDKIDKTLADAENADSLREEFIAEFENVCNEATGLVKDIEGLSAGELLDKKEVFLDSIKGIIDNFEDFKKELSGTQINEPFFVYFPKKVGKIVTKNRVALATFIFFQWPQGYTP